MGNILGIILIAPVRGITSYLISSTLYFLLSIFGFTSTGVSAGSLAALWQSFMGGVISAGSLFSFLQSASMSAWL
ncbi:hypothetical protein HI914_03166 [Erysiphe necator]|nr:hypothetical protein HI914_03166 [Erysiphe necator]